MPYAPGSKREGGAYMFTCPRCGKRAPEFDERGMHNFCPATYEPRNICMDCKMKEVLAKWKNP